ncbi:MAG: RNA polymerase subunit sigma-70 [Gammaproteobacteria bacterium HGW-Gammaproteobacteria-11]|nr:MAG: RNA polymerase subunit sigma-70 [Gammaproteobacteria bacterium HGW-Gammaproteobacteria-11]
MSPNTTEQLLQAGYRYALALRGRPDDARDLVHEAWLRLNGQWLPILTKARLFRTIRNLFIDQYRRDQLMVMEPLELHSDLYLAHEVALDREIHALELTACLGQLRAPEREALFLNSVEGYTVSEIAQMTGRPRGTVLSLIHRAKEKMRALLVVDESAASESDLRGQPNAR